MTLDEAIARLEQSGRWYESLNASEQAQAHQLGIEALKQLKECREDGCKFFSEPLLGETVEGQHGPLTDAEREIVDREYKAGCEQLRQWYANGKLSGGGHANP